MHGISHIHCPDNEKIRHFRNEPSPAGTRLGCAGHGLQDLDGYGRISNLKQIIFILICLTTWTNGVQAEGIWSVDGYHLSNVNVLHKLNTVHVSGRIQGGKFADYLKIRILVSNDNGYRGWAETSLQNYSGKGELFESQFKYYQKSRIWNIEQIDIVGNKIDGSKSNQNSNPHYKSETLSNNQYFEQPIQPTQDKEYKQKSYPSKRNTTEETSDVLFSSFQNVSIIIKDIKTNKIVIMRNISPHNLEEVVIEKGQYTALIIGNGFNKEKQFDIKEDKETIDLN